MTSKASPYIPKFLFPFSILSPAQQTSLFHPQASDESSHSKNETAGLVPVYSSTDELVEIPRR